MNDFIFGTLSTDALRLADVRARRSGVTHRSARFPLAPRPSEPVDLELTVGPAHPLCARAWVYWSTDGQDPHGQGGQAAHGQALSLEPAGVEWDTLLWGYVRRYRVRLPAQPQGTVVRYLLTAECGTEGELPADGGLYYAYAVDETSLPAWAENAVIYQVFVDRFFPGSDRSWLTPSSPGGFSGGTLRGITEKLDHITALGADVLWLTPIFPSPSHHGYDATDLFEIEPRLGSKADLRDLLDAAHARGLRVLLDFVPNHWSSGHATFQAALSDPGSPYRDWYSFTRWPTEYETFFGVRDLPRVNLRWMPARKHMLDAARYWLDFGADGYRVDYAVGPTPDFWADFRRATRQARPDCWTFGEVVEPSNSQLAFHGLLDGCLDFMLLEGLRQTFAFGAWDAARFAGFLDRHEAYFPSDFSRPSFLDNHDMNRILWAMQGDQRRLRLAALCQFTLSGPPVIYYGTEVGLSQERDVRQGERGIPEEARLPMLWDEAQDRDLFAFYQSLVSLRRRFPILARGRRRTLLAQAGLLAYERIPVPGERDAASAPLAAAFNLSHEAQQIELPGQWEEVLLAVGECSLSGKDSHRSLTLAPWSGCLLLGVGQAHRPQGS
jgi:cyclomaltodextrinase / maltogenic alpha-amylase / neopullulanase